MRGPPVGGKTVIFEKKGSMGVITLNRPEQKNAVSAQMAAELREIRKEIDRESGIAVVILTGKGTSFSIGTEAEDYARFPDREDFIRNLSAAATIGSLAQPTLGAINGDAMGQGLEVALACDLRIASVASRFAMPQITRGEIPFDGGTQRLPRILGRAKAIEMILEGRIIGSGEALRIGLVNRVVPDDELMPAALKAAEELQGKAPVALRYAKEAVWKGMDMTLDQGLRLEADLYFLLHTTGDRTEGISAFREKRAPRFKGK